MALASPSSRKLTALGALTALAVTVSACGGSSSSYSSPSSSTEAATSAPTTAEAPAATTSASGSAVTAAAGKKVFLASCTSCHTLADAGSTGTVGPNLDDLEPDMALVVKQVTNGGGGMPAFGSQLSRTQIQAVAKYVSSVAGKAGTSNGSTAVGGAP
jgi:mono/diheme cytochrome c family protein